MLEGVPVEIHKMIVIVGIYQEIIVHGKNITAAQIAPGQVDLLGLKYFKYLLFILVQIPALLVA